MSKPTIIADVTEAPRGRRKDQLQYPPEAVAKAEALYMQHYNTPQIARLCGIPGAFLTVRIQNTWKKRRQQREKEMVEAVIEDNKYHLSRLFSVSLPLLTDAIANRAKEHYGDPEKGIVAKPLSMKETKILGDLITNVDTLFRLETNRPTQMHKHVSISLSDLKKIMEGDPFINLGAEGKLALPEGDESGRDVTPRTADDIPTLPDDGLGDPVGGDDGGPV